MNASGQTDTQTSPPQISELDQDAKQSISILVIDDERTLRESCCSVLSKEGYRVEVCGMGHEAMGLLNRRRFDIILNDR